MATVTANPVTVPAPLTAITAPACPATSNSGAADMQRSLRNAMRIPAANRMVADFLFADLTQSAFHASYVLPPSAITTSLALRIEEHINNGGVTGGGIGVGQPINPQTGYRLIFDQLFIPVCYAEPYALGYAFNVEAHGENSFCLPGTPFESPCVGRFVFDTRTGDILKVSHGGTPQAIGLHSMHSRVGTNASYTCDHEILIVPSVPYEWPYLPSTVLWKISTRVVRDMSSEPASALLPPQPHLPPVFDRTPWPVNADGVCADGSSPSRLSNANDSLFASQPLQFSLSVMSKHLCGQFKAPGFRLDVLKTVLPSHLVDTTANHAIGKVLFAQASTATTVRIREHFASAYYLAALLPTADASLVVASSRPPQQHTYNFNHANAHPYFNDAIPSAQQQQPLEEADEQPSPPYPPTVSVPVPMPSSENLIDILLDPGLRTPAVVGGTFTKLHAKQKRMDHNGTQSFHKFVSDLKHTEQQHPVADSPDGVNTRPAAAVVTTPADQTTQTDTHSSEQGVTQPELNVCEDNNDDGNVTAKDRASSSAIDLNLDLDCAPILDGMGGPNLSHDANLDVAQFGGNEILQDMLDWLPSTSPSLPSSSSAVEEDSQCDEYILPQSHQSLSGGSNSSSSGSASASCGKGSSCESLPNATPEDKGNEESTTPTLSPTQPVLSIPTKTTAVTGAKRLAPRPQPIIQPCPQPQPDLQLQLQLQLQQPPSPPLSQLTQTRAQAPKERKSSSPKPNSHSNSHSNSNSSKSSDISRKEMLEARRRRNRISAARSNERKRLMLEQLKRDMQTQKERAEELKAVEQRALVENQRLKTLLLNKQRVCST